MRVRAGIKAIDLLHHAQRGLQAGAVENIAGVNRPGFEQSPCHPWQQCRRAAAKLPRQSDMRGSDTAYPAEDEILFFARQEREFRR